LTYSWSGTRDGSRDRTTPEGLNRDLVFGDNYNFNLVFDDDVDVSLATTIGDQCCSRTGNVTVDGVSLPISVAANNFQTVTHTPDLNSSYTINLTGTDLTVTTILVTGSDGSVLAAFDFGTSTSPVEYGYIGVNDLSLRTVVLQVAHLLMVMEMELMIT